LITFILPGGGGEFGSLPINVAIGANYPVVAIPNPPGADAARDPFGAVRSANAILVEQAILTIGGGLKPNEPINIIAHSDANQAVVNKLVVAIKALNLPANIYVGRLDPTFKGKPPRIICESFDVGSNKPLSLDPRDIAAAVWWSIFGADYRARFGVGHMDLLNDPDVLRF
jgi:hypothetical protein